ncbi:MAG: peptidoglycan bridge formation glycyltransferase FemA/FemB family protein [Candidatus Nealsonbacteria bacterium]
MEIKEINNKEIWESFLSECEETTFVDSWNWGEFQKKQEEQVWRIGIFDNNEIIASALVIKIKARRGSFLFCPHAPNIRKEKTINNKKILKTLLDELKEIAKQEKVSFIRISPIWQNNKENIAIFKDLGFKNAPIHMHPEITWELDIIPPEEQLLANMRKTTRYLIKQAEKNNDIEIIKSENINDLEKFYNIYKETVKRHHFSPFSLNYFKNQFLEFKNDNQILIFLGKYKNEVVSSSIVIFSQNIAFYHHGASLSKYNKIPVSYLLQWTAIKEAKQRECEIYNFWGIAPDIKDKSDISKSKHPWAGLTLFKMGFGGYKEEYVPTQDFIISKKYYLTYIFEKIRKIKRRL